MVLKLFNKDKVYSPSEKVGEYTILRALGEGRYGICYLASKGDKQYILKQLKKDMLKQAGEKAKYEQEVLDKIHYESIPKFIEKLQYDKFTGYVLEYKEGKTFEEIIYVDNYVFSKEEIYEIGLQLINISEYLHSLRIVHRDIRVPNVLYHNGKVILLDFGLARWVNNERYTPDVDFSYLGDFLIHLYYTAYEVVDEVERPWYEELELEEDEKRVLKRLMGVTERYKSIEEVKKDFLMLKAKNNGIVL